MKIAFGLKVHSGWAALVVLGANSGGLEVVDRRRMELVEADEARWAMQPYHAAGLSLGRDARAVVKCGIHSARRIALREMRAAIKRAHEAKHEIVGCAVLMADPMPDWSVDEILAVHFRMHKAEGVLFRDALARATVACDLKLAAIPEKSLYEQANKTLAIPVSSLQRRIETLGKSVGPPWGKDQKDAALAAWMVLQGNTR